MESIVSPFCFDVEYARKEQERLKGKTDEVQILKNQFRTA
jgi:hypothetical protein